ncbi:glycosyltransferase family 4 protein [Acuticoccus kandeliae]|uniref:glycosyltransferase family 4 protein n=1 Tax=Acuticoccus kandeliae TaxID=2073160 RepID=UPI001300A6B1|nr:glycosyltransferase family 4 protein [Acuticoccus kandeliae]
MYWIFGTNIRSLGEGIPYRWLAHPIRYMRQKPMPGVDRALRRVVQHRSEAARQRTLQRLNDMRKTFMANLCEVVSVPGTLDTALVEDLERAMIDDKVSHLFVGMGLLGTFAEAVEKRGRHRFTWHMTIQGDDLAADYARDGAAKARFVANLQRLVSEAQPTASAVSQNYATFLAETLGLDLARLDILYPGLEISAPVPKDDARRLVERLMPSVDWSLPLISFVGRNDAEKGIDIFLYALRILKARGLRFQAAIAGASLFGQTYRQACEQIATRLDVPVRFLGPLSNQERDALYGASHTIVYPSIIAEGFGMVPAEAMAQGTPVVVPRIGGLVEAVSDGVSTGGLTFAPWDSGDMADQLERLLVDGEFHQSLAQHARPLAERFDVGRIADRLMVIGGMIPDRSSDAPLTISA